MKTIISVLISCTALLLAGCSRSPASFAELLQTELPYADELQAALDEGVQSTGVVGVSAAIIVDGEGIWSGVSGESYPGHPVAPDMLFDMGSAGKMLVGPLVVKLAEEGLLSLDDPIRDYLPDFPYADGDITIRQLLNHTSGLYMMVNSPNGPFRTPFAQIDHQKWWTIAEIFTDLGGEPYHPPGQGYCYTQAGYQIATLIVEEVTGETTAEQIRTRLLDPLDIDGMVLDYTAPLPGGFEIAHPWLDLDYDGEYEDIHNYSRNWITSLSRIYSHTTAQDFAIWGHALFTGEVLNQESMDLLLDFYRTDDWCGDEAFLIGYGMGVQDFNPAITHGQPAWGHLGSIQGSRAMLAHLHQQGITMVVLTNTDTDNAMAVVDRLIGTVLDHAARAITSPTTLEIEPVSQPPDQVNVIETFQKETLFCEHSPTFEVKAGPADWIDISLEWVVGANETIAEEVWPLHEHTITINAQEIENLEAYTHDVIQYSVLCPDESLEIWAKGYTLYLPPLPGGTYEIVWHSEVTEDFNNGWVDYTPGNYLEIRTILIVE